MFALPKLPYAYDALQPVISERTMHFHHDKHHGAYIKTLNTLLEKTGGPPKPLEQIIRDASKAGEKKLFNNAAQAWNHSFFWASMTEKFERPNGDLAGAITTTFGDLAALKTAFVTAGAEHFGSGWVWLTSDKGGGLKVISTHDAEDTLIHGEITPLLVCDLWEHAYYLDHQNDRKAYLEGWFDALPHWEFAGYQYAAARGRGDSWRRPAPEAAPAQKSA